MTRADVLRYAIANALVRAPRLRGTHLGAPNRKTALRARSLEIYSGTYRSGGGKSR